MMAPSNFCMGQRARSPSCSVPSYYITSSGMFSIGSQEESVKTDWETKKMFQEKPIWISHLLNSVIVPYCKPFVTQSYIYTLFGYDVVSRQITFILKAISCFSCPLPPKPNIQFPFPHSQFSCGDKYSPLHISTIILWIKESWKQLRNRLYCGLLNSQKTVHKQCPT